MKPALEITRILTIPALLGLGLAACGGDETDTPDNPDGLDVPATVVRSAALMNVDGTPSATGAISIRTDAAGKRYIYLGESFAQDMGPGDTELRLAKGSNNIADQMAADATSVSASLGIIPNGGSGEFLFEIPASVDDDAFSYAVVWCPTAGVNFGIADLGGDADRSWTATLTNVDGTPSATGAVTIQETGVGTFEITLGADFAQDMGPGDTEIRLAKTDMNVADQLAADAGNASDAIGIVANGSSGTMTFDFSGTEPSDFGYVVIWCPTAAVNFGVGTLAAETN